MSSNVGILLYACWCFSIPKAKFYTGVAINYLSSYHTSYPHGNTFVLKIQIDIVISARTFSNDYCDG